MNRYLSRQCTMLAKSPISEEELVSCFVFQLLFLFSRFFIISAQPSSSSSSSSTGTGMVLGLVAAVRLPLETGRTVADGTEALADVMLDRRFSSFHGFGMGICSGSMAVIGRYRGAAPTLLRSDGAIDGAEPGPAGVPGRIAPDAAYGIGGPFNRAGMFGS